MRLGLIGGTGHAEDAGDLAVTVETPYGDVDLAVREAGAATWFRLNRHGRGHRVPPHRIPFRANVEALARSRVDYAVAVNAVGALDERAGAGTLVVPDDYLDLSGRTERTFFDDDAVHVDVTEAYCPVVRRALVEAARAEAAPVLDGGVYVAMPGPRFETRAETRMLRQLGGTVVGMTGCPEAALARERCLCYASLCLVTNLAAGMAAPPSAADVVARAREVGALAERVVARLPGLLPAERTCACAVAVRDARV